MNSIIQKIGIGILLLCATTNIAAQPLPLDNRIVTGKLPNGLTYFIYPNSEPKNRVEFHIAQQVGSILEEENQRGLAHFLEHMAFNGTKNFPHKTMLQYLQNNGLSFGGNINAYTSIDQTVYRLSDVPADKPALIDSCLLVLHDWACAISLDDKEIDNERGVIREEWRTGQNGFMRMFEKQLPEMYPDSRYGYRLPIGTMQVIDNFTHTELRDYYHKWYRPDLQGIVIVGDINAQKMEEKIKQLFSTIPTPVNPAKRTYYPVPDTKDTIVSIATDPEATANLFYLFAKHDILPAEQQLSIPGSIQTIYRRMMGAIMNERLEDLLKKGDIPFLSAGIADDNYYIARTKDALMAAITCKEGRELEALRTIATEIERARRYGFTASEFNRAKINTLNELENAYREHDKRKNIAIAQEIIRYFCDNEAMPGIEKELEIARTVLDNLNEKTLSHYFVELLSDPHNRIVSYSGKQKEGVAAPTREQILAQLAEVQNDSTILAPKEEETNRPLIQSTLPIGSIRKETTDRHGNQLVELSNGIRIVVKPTDFKNNEILMSATSPGGTSLYPTPAAREFLATNILLPRAGLGEFSTSDLQKALAGKQVGLTFSVEKNEEKFTGSTTPQDMETLFRLLYLQFTSPGKDTTGFETYRNLVAEAIRQQEIDPRAVFNDSITSTLYPKNSRSQRVTPNEIARMSLTRATELYRERTKNPADYTFVFVGNINIDSLKTYALRYLSGLPTLSTREKARQSEPAIQRGKIENNFNREGQTPKSSVCIVYSATTPYNRNNSLLASILNRYLNIAYTESVREKESGTYGVRVRCSINNNPKNEALLSIQFDTNEAQQEKLRLIVNQELTKVATQGVDQADFNKVIENLLKAHQEAVRQNNYWLSTINRYYIQKEDLFTDTEKRIHSITPKMIQTFAQRFTRSGSRIEIIMNQQVKTEK